MSLFNAAGATMSFVAHVDDDLLFQNPDIQESISAGGGHTTVYLTAGDAGLGADHWQAREAGAKSAYGEMAGANDWVDAVATFGNDETSIDVQTSYLESQPEVRLYFLRLPDGYTGTGYDVTNFESLEKLWDNEIESVSSLDGTNTVTADNLSGLLLGLMNHHQPDQLLIQDHSSEHVESNHSDHVSSSLFTYDAQQYYTTDHEVHSYLEYATASMPSNQTSEDSALTLDVYHAYLQGYYNESDPDLVPEASGVYLKWTSRHYHVDNLDSADDRLSDTQSFATLEFVSEANVENGTSIVIGSEGDDDTIVPCFTPGTLISTANGERRVEDLKVGDRIITRDHGMQPIRWIGRKDLAGDMLFAKTHLRPILIRQGALGNDLPARDMMVSPQHRILISSAKTKLYFDESEVLVPAKHLTQMEGIDVVEVPHISYIHILFDRHEIVLSDGIWTESFQPGNLALAGIDDGSKNEILELFPELNATDLANSYATARRSLKRYEAYVL